MGIRRLRGGIVAVEMGPEGEIPPESPVGEAGVPEPQPAAPPEPQRSQLLSNEDIDTLLAGLDDPSPEADPPSAAAQAIAKAKAQAPVQDAASSDNPKSQLLSNQDIDALLSRFESGGEDAQEPSASPDVPPAPGTSGTPPKAAENQLLSNDDIEALLASMGSDSSDEEEAVASSEDQAVSAPASEVLGNDDIEALMAEMNSNAAEVEETPEPAVEESAPSQNAQLLNNDDLDSLLATLNAEPEEAVDAPPSTGEPEAAKEEETAPESPVASKAVPESPAPNPQEEAPAAVPQALIESLIQGARSRTTEGSAPAAPPPQEPPREPSPAPSENRAASDEVEEGHKHSRFPIKLAASLAIGFFFGACVYLYLVMHPYRELDPEAMKALRVTIPEQSFAVAKGLAEGGRYSEARHELEPVLDALPAGDARNDAEFLDVEAAYHLLPDEAKIPVLNNLRKRIEGLLAAAPNHPKAADALSWKADLLRRSEMPEAAYEVYKEVLTRTDNPPGFDKVLLDAAGTAVQAQLPNEALNHLRRLLQAYPASPLRGEGEFLLGEAYLASGDAEAGRMTLMSVARAHPDSALGAEAFAKLGSLSYDAGDYDEAIRLFETRLQTATKVAGNDIIYLLLARAHRAKGDLSQAEHVLRELVEFFPESKEIPAAMVELSQVLDGLGRRDEAVNVAKQAAQQYANNPEVLANAGRFLSQAGEATAGADTLVAAEHAGAENPAVLLEAARQYRAAKDLDKAAETYQRILDDYSTSKEAFVSGIELARVDYEKGRIRKALERLEDNAAHAKGRPGHAESLDALGSLYQDLGLKDRAAETFRELASVTSDPVLLARSASMLFDAGDDKDALALAGRIDTAALPESLAYGLLMREGASLAKNTPDQAIALMEQAYQSYPDERRPEDVRRLLDGYLALDRSAAARALVVDAETRAKANPAEIPTLESAAARWGDYLYGRGDYTAAMEAYGLAATAAGGDAKASGSENRQWSRFQQANCLLQQGDLQGSRPLFEEVANGTSPWSEVARAKAEYIGLELRRRGTPPAEAELPAPTQPAREG